MAFRQHPKWYHALHALHFGFAGGLAYVVAVGALLVYPASPAWLRQVHANGYGVFLGTSFWNTPIPRYPMASGDSDSQIQALLGQIQSVGATFDTSNEAAPVYAVDAATPVVSVVPVDCGQGIDASLASQWQAVPLPFYAVPSNGPSHRLVVYQSSSQTIWEFGQMQKVGSQWQACHGGRISVAGNGIFGGSQGVMGSGLALLGGQVGVDDLQRGTIGHAIGLSMPDTGGISWPAARSDGVGGQIAQGTRLHLDPTINVDALGLSPVGRLLAKTAQTYGFVVWGTSQTVSVFGENPLSYTVRGLASPYNSIGGASLSGFPWGSLRALPANYGQSGTPPPGILDFSSSTANALAGRQISFSWQAINVDECAIPGIASHLAATGSVTGYDLHADTSYTLSCTGPGGSISRSLSLTVSGLPTTTPVSPTIAITIDSPLTGLATVLPQFDYSWAATTVYKVVYYERDNFLQATTTPPFALDTTKLSDGPHRLVAQIYFRDAHRENQNINVRVQNHTASLVFAGPLAAHTPASPVGKIATISGMTGMFVVMIAGAWFGWNRLHPHSKRPRSWLISYV
jgi:hypothetical protein